MAQGLSTRKEHHSAILVIVALTTLCLAACQSGAATPTLEELGAPPAKLLATVFMSPTPGEAEQQATRAAVVPSPTPRPPTPIPTPTPYVGVFIGEAQQDNSEAVVNPALLNTPVETLLTPAQNACTIPPNDVFGAAWQQNDSVVRRLGCPIQIMFGFDGTVQIFERGVMYWRKDTSAIWAIVPGGAGAGKFWFVAQPPNLTTSEFTAPDGLRVPSGGFGGVWKGVPGVRDALGFAQTDEQSVKMAMQLFDGGSLLLDSNAGQVFALMVNGDAFGPY